MGPIKPKQEGKGTLNKVFQTPCSGLPYTLSGTSGGSSLKESQGFGDSVLPWVLGVKRELKFTQRQLGTVIVSATEGKKQV